MQPPKCISPEYICDEKTRIIHEETPLKVQDALEEADPIRQSHILSEKDLMKHPAT